MRRTSPQRSKNQTSLLDRVRSLAKETNIPDIETRANNIQAESERIATKSHGFSVVAFIKTQTRKNLTTKKIVPPLTTTCAPCLFVRTKGICSSLRLRSLRHSGDLCALTPEKKRKRGKKKGLTKIRTMPRARRSHGSQAHLALTTAQQHDLSLSLVLSLFLTCAVHHHRSLTPLCTDSRFALFLCSPGLFPGPVVPVVHRET